MKTQLRKSTKGFTIIEVMIVLAIAGLILAIVFLAVPALQRNSRNTQTRNDAANYLAAVNEWAANNNGNVPKVPADLTAAGTGVNSLAKLGTLTAPVAVVTGIQSGVIVLGSLQYVQAAKCDPAVLANTIGGPQRSTAVRFSVENSGGNTIGQCQES